MARDILKEIVDRRITDIEKKGWNLGFEIPVQRTRKVHPFLNEKGVILEVKRASPSKGDIAPGLDSAATARSYAECGARAISCLTEENYFKGTIDDLKKVCAAVDKYEEETGRTGPAVLRKDFLIDEKEIEIAYNCGADAVLLISRILDTPKMISMARKCQELGITGLIELRLDEDVEKLAEVVKNVDPKYIACGVNSRDLATFAIDLLTPVTMLAKIKKVLGEDARVIFESGIRTPVSAGFVGSLGFAGMLLGEAAAKNPQIRKDLVDSFTNATSTSNAEFWTKYSSKLSRHPELDNRHPEHDNRHPELVSGSLAEKKVCGITNEEDAVKAAELGADFLGFIFYDKSPRKVNPENVKAICDQLNSSKAVKVAVIVDPESAEGKRAIDFVKDGTLDVLQLHTMDCARKFLAVKENRELPHYAAINISSEDDIKNLDELFDLGEPRVLVDAQTNDKIGGTGKQISPELIALVQKKYKLWLAGGVTPENVSEVIEKYHPELVDCASGTESEPGKKDLSKLAEYLG